MWQEKCMSAMVTPGRCQGNWGFANSLGLLVLRLVLGAVFVYTGSGKLFGAFGGMGMTNWVHAIESMHLPVLPAAVWAWMAACGEFFGGLFVLLGLLTRLAAIPIVVTMLVAIAEVHGRNGFMGKPVEGAPGAQYAGYAFNLALIAMSVALILSGAGLVSLDALIFKRGLWARGPQPLDKPETRGS
jgi:putative oxidoreductase